MPSRHISTFDSDRILFTGSYQPAPPPERIRWTPIEVDMDRGMGINSVTYTWWRNQRTLTDHEKWLLELQQDPDMWVDEGL